MPIAKIQLPDGRIAKFEVPEGTTPDQVTQFATQQFSSAPEQPQRPESRADFVPSPTSGMSTGQLAAAGAGKAVSDAGLGIGQMLSEHASYAGDESGVVPVNVPEIREQSQADVDAARKRDAPLMDTTAGKVGNIGGNVAMTLPALAVPGVNTYAGAGMMGGLMGMVQPTAEGESRTLNTALGAGAGVAGQGVGQLLGKALSVPKMAANKVAKIEAEAGERAAKSAASETASARSAAGNAAQDTYRQLEHLRELNAKGLLTKEGKQAAKALEKELAEKAADKLLPSAARKETTAAAYKEAVETESDRAAKMMAEKLSSKEVKSQIMARLKRYGPAAAGGMIGNMLFPGLGGMVGGAATGLTLRPAIRSMANLLKNPALQRKALLPIAKMAQKLPPKQRSLFVSELMKATKDIGTILPASLGASTVASE